MANHPMSPLEALQFLEQATAHVTGDRAAHMRILEACKIIGAALMESAVQERFAGQPVKVDGQ